jgi:WD40 repeat protein
MLAWSKSSSVLAAGTAKGNLQLYHLQERRRTPVVGKHTKRVCAGAWSPGSNLLAMAALDKTVRPVVDGGGGLSTPAAALGVKHTADRETDDSVAATTDDCERPGWGHPEDSHLQGRAAAAVRDAVGRGRAPPTQRWWGR